MKLGKQINTVHTRSAFWPTRQQGKSVCIETCNCPSVVNATDFMAEVLIVFSLPFTAAFTSRKIYMTLTLRVLYYYNEPSDNRLLLTPVCLVMLMNPNDSWLMQESFWLNVYMKGVALIRVSQDYSMENKYIHFHDIMVNCAVLHNDVGFPLLFSNICLCQPVLSWSTALAFVILSSWFLDGALTRI